MVGSGDLNEDVPVILVIEDEEAIQSLVEDALTEGGFEPAIAASGEEAVTLLSLRGRIDGWEVAKQAREIDPQFPIVYMSGASADDWALQRRSQQHHVIQAVRAGSTCDRRLQPSQRRHADSLAACTVHNLAAKRLTRPGGRPGGSGAARGG